MLRSALHDALFLRYHSSPNAPTRCARRNRPLPRALPFIIGSEVAERFSYYGMMTILPTFLVAQFFNPTHSARPISG